MSFRAVSIRRPEGYEPSTLPLRHETPMVPGEARARTYTAGSTSTNWPDATAVATGVR
jgi:hypothetical protein